GPPQPVLAGASLDLGPDRDVVRAVRDRDHADPRPTALELGPVRPDDLGLRDDDRLAGAVPDPVLPVRPLPADDLDHRDARAAAEEPGRRRRALDHGERVVNPTPTTPAPAHGPGNGAPVSYGVLAEVETGDAR